jgi:putative aldouronate transport system substrate-binding protein
MKSHFASFAAALIIICSMTAGCARKQESKASDSITLSFFTADSTEDMPFTDPVALEIQKKTGVTLEVEHPVAGDAQAIPLMLASGEYPDLIYAKGELTKLIDAGAVIPLDDYIEKYGTNMKKLYGDQIVKLRNSSEDRHIYSAGTYGVKEQILETTGTMQLQHAVLKELGYPKISTLDEYSDAIRTYMKKYPEINGQKTIGLSLLIDTWQWYIDLSNPGNYTIGYPDDGQWIVDQKTLKAQYKFLNPEIYRYYKWLNKMNAEGLLDPESFTQKEDVWKSKIASGRVLGITYPIWGYNDARMSLIQNNMSERTYAYLPVTAGKQFKDPSRKNYGYSGGWGIAISTSCKDPVRAFRFLDWMCSEEAQILCNWGIKDVDYYVGQDGRRARTADEIHAAETDPDYSKKTGVGRWTYPFPMMGNAAVDSNGDNISVTSRETIIAKYLPVEKETLAAYGAEMWIDLFPAPEELGVSKHGQVWQYALPSDINAKVTAADEFVKTTLAQLVLGSPADFDRGWTDMQTNLKKMGLDQAGDTLSDLIAMKIKLWNEK